MSELTSPHAEQAVIYVGAASLSIVIGYQDHTQGFVEIEHMDRPLPIARDIFRTGIVTRSTMEQAAGILRDFLRSTKEYGISLEAIRLYNTNILSEATNHEIFLNRLQVTTGLAARLIDDGDMTRLVYQIARRLLQQIQR